MILSDKEIRKLSVEDPALIQPFDEKCLQGAPYDVSIGSNVYILEKQIKPINLLKQDQLDKIYKTVKIDKDGYIINPGEYILVDLNEFISLPDNIIAHIRPRTKFTRIGLLVSDQHCNPSYKGRLKIGLFNASSNAIILVPELNIAQIIFEELKSIPSENKLYRNKENASYQNEDSFIGSKFDQNELNNVAMELYQKLLSEM